MLDNSKILVTAIKDPFDPWKSRVTKFVDYEGKTVSQYVQELYLSVPDDCEIVASIDGKIIDQAEEVIPSGGSSLVFCLAIKDNDVFRIIAFIIVMVVAWYVAPAFAGAAMGSGMAGTGAAGMIGFAAISAAGAYAINALLPPLMPDMGSLGNVDDESSTYGWSARGNLSEEGGAYPVIYGTVRIVPYIINQYITTLDNKQYLNVLFLLADHFIESVSDVEIDDNPSTGYEDIIIETAMGDVSQEATFNFKDSYSELVIGLELSTDWQTQTVLGDVTAGLVVAITFPNGLYNMSTSGTVLSTTVDITMEFRLVADGPGGAWTPLITPNEGVDDWEKYPGDGFWHFYYVGDLVIAPNGHVYRCITQHSPTGGWGGWGTSYPDGIIPGVITNVTFTRQTNWCDGEYDTETFTRAQMIWQQYWAREYDTVVYGKTREALRKSYRVDNIPAGEYEVRVKFYAEPPSGTTYMNTTYWDHVQSIVYDDFSYPGAALLAMDVLATDQLSGGMPTISALVTRGSIHVHDGTGWVEKPSTNPAWAVYDMHVEPHYGAGIDYRRMIYQDFSDWADFCDEFGYTCNIYFDNFASFAEQVAKISTVGRARVVQKGTSFGVVVDKERDPVQLFGMQNITENTFQINYLARADRANVIEVSYFDADEGYRRQTFETRTSDFDTNLDIEERRITVVLYACTSKTQAEAFGKFLLNCNEHLLRTVSFSTGVDALASTVGDVIYVSHDAPIWGYSGRVVAATMTTITLDREVYMGEGLYYNVLVRYQADDSIEEVKVNTVPGTSNYLTLTGEFSTLPLPDDVYSFGEVTKVSKEFCIVTLSRSEDMNRMITALEYHSEVYNDFVEVPDYESETPLPAVQALDVVESWTLEGGVGKAFINLSWRGFGLMTVYQKDQDEGVWKIVGSTQNQGSNDLSLYNVEVGRTYDFSVASAGQGPDDGKIVTGFSLTGKPPAPEIPANVVSFWKEEGFGISWDQNLMPWTLGYDIAIDDAIKAKAYGGTEFLFGELLVTGTYNFQVRTRDAFEQVSAWVSPVMNVIAHNAPTNFLPQVIDNNVLLRWTEAVGGTLPIVEYEIRRGDVDWDNSEVIGTKKGTFTIIFETVSGTFKYRIKAKDSAGSLGAEATVTATVSQPPDFVLNVQWDDQFDGGTPDKMYVDALNLGWAPCDLAETFEEHFTNNGATDMQDMIDGGYIYYMEPVGELTASYEEEHDYGTLLGSSLITVDLDKTDYNDGVTVITKIAIKAEPGDSWVETATTRLYATAFRYVKVTFEITAPSDTDFAKFIIYVTRLDSKLMKDSGFGTTGDDGTVKVYFNIGFVDVVSISVTPKTGATPIYATYDFVDIPWPAAFFVHTFDAVGDPAPTKDFSWNVSGYSAGESLTTTTTTTTSSSTSSTSSTASSSSTSSSTVSSSSTTTTTGP